MYYVHQSIAIPIWLEAVVRQSWTIFAGRLERTYVKNQTGQCFNPSEENKVYQSYYQWVSLMLFGQAAILYIPAYLWKLSEGGLMHKICVDLGMIEIR